MLGVMGKTGRWRWPNKGGRSGGEVEESRVGMQSLLGNGNCSLSAM